MAQVIETPTPDEMLISAIAHAASAYVELFADYRKECKVYAQNTLTKDHNCYHGNTKTECNHELCPLKEIDDGSE